MGDLHWLMEMMTVGATASVSIIFRRVACRQILAEIELGMHCQNYDFIHFHSMWMSVMLFEVFQRLR